MYMYTSNLTPKIVLIFGGLLRKLGLYFQKKTK